jgi:hypothetical protein
VGTKQKIIQLRRSDRKVAISTSGQNAARSPKRASNLRQNQKAGTDATPPLTNCQTELNQELKKLEASIEGAMRGDWARPPHGIQRHRAHPAQASISQKCPSTRKSRNNS